MKLLAGAGRLIGWVGASASAIALILAVFGYLVESAYLARFGVRRGVIDLGQNEYVLSGGQFVIGIPALLLAGALEFALRRWYLVLAIAAICVAGRWRRLGTTFVWSALAALHAIWLALTLSALEQPLDDLDARAQVAMLTFTTITALGYAWLARPPAVPAAAAQPVADAASETASVRRIAARAPYVVTLMVAIVMLPYVRGTYGQLRDTPIIELDPKQAQAVCDFACPGTSCALDACRNEQWRLVAFGRNKVVLSSVRDGKIYVTPAAAIQEFRIVGRMVP